VEDEDEKLGFEILVILNEILNCFKFQIYFCFKEFMLVKTIFCLIILLKN